MKSKKPKFGKNLRKNIRRMRKAAPFKNKSGLKAVPRSEQKPD